MISPADYAQLHARTRAQPGRKPKLYRLRVCPSEEAEQCQVITWALLHDGQYPDLKLLYASANGGLRHIAVARKLKASGVKPGVPDLHLPVARGGYHGLWIEMKAMDGTVSDEQHAWIDALLAEGACVCVSFGAAAAIAMLTNYLRLPKTVVKK